MLSASYPTLVVFLLKVVRLIPLAVDFVALLLCMCNTSHPISNISDNPNQDFKMIE